MAQISISRIKVIRSSEYSEPIAVVKIVGQGLLHLGLYLFEEFGIGEDEARQQKGFVHGLLQVVKEQFCKQIWVTLLLCVDIAVEVANGFRAAVEQVREDKLSMSTDFLHHFRLNERVVGFEPRQSVRVMHNVRDADEVADVLLNACKITIFLLVVVECHLDERGTVRVAFVVARGLEIGVGKLRFLLVRVLSVLALDAKHSQTIVADKDDVHIRRAVNMTTFGRFGHHGELDFEIDLIVGRAVESQRVLRANPMEEIVREHRRREYRTSVRNVQLAVFIGVVLQFVPVTGHEHVVELALGQSFATACKDILCVRGQIAAFRQFGFRKEVDFLKVIFRLCGRVFDCDFSCHNCTVFEICCKITTRECHPAALSVRKIDFPNKNYTFLRSSIRYSA